MKKNKWLRVIVAILIAATFSVGAELILDSTIDKQITESESPAIIVLFPGETASLINCEYREGYLIPQNDDPQIIIPQQDNRELSNVSVRFGQPLGTECMTQLFYDDGDGFSEEKSIRQMVQPGEDSVHFPLEKGHYNVLRIDINGTVPIQSIDCDSTEIISHTIPGEINKKRLAAFVILFSGVFITIIFCLSDDKWKSGVHATKEMISGKAFYYVVVSVALNIFLSLYYHLGDIKEVSDGLKIILHPNWPGIVILFLIMFGCHYVTEKCNIDFYGFLHKWRWVIAAAVLIVAVFYKINGSSLNQWTWVLNEYDQNGVLFGVARGIRSDEWARGIPTTKALSMESFPLYSSILRGTRTETIVTNGGISWDFSAVFRPFAWGYLLFGFDYGVSFHWCSLFICLFMVSYDLFNMVSHNRKLAFTFAVAIVFSPLVQWWFDTALTPILISSFGLIIVAKKYLLSQSLKIKILLAAIVYILMGNFVLTFYPAWIVPAAYVMLGFLIWVIVENKRDIHLKAKMDIPVISGTLILFCVSMIAIYLRSAPEIQCMMNTVYPGTTRTYGTQPVTILFTNILNATFPIMSNFAAGANVCEVSSLFTLFPLGILLSVYAMIRKKKTDLFCIIMLILSAFFALFTFVDVPLIIRQVTLMNLTMSYRVAPWLAMVQVMLLFRAISLLSNQKGIKWYWAILSTLLLTGYIVWQIRKVTNFQGFEWVFAGTMLLLILMIFVSINVKNNSKSQTAFATVMIIVALFTGGLVNPIQVGADEIEKSTLLSEIKTIVEKDTDGKWIVENMSYPYGNIPIMAGAPTITCVNSYPNLTLWKQLDPEEDDEYYYNRFAGQITTNLVDEDRSVFLPGDADDQMKIRLDVDDLKVLQVSYLLSNRELEVYSKENVRIEKIYDNGSFKIFHVDNDLKEQEGI